MKTALTLPPAPRQVEIRRGTKFGRGFAWFIALASLIGIAISMSTQMARLQKLMTNGKTFQAQVISAEHISGKSGGYFLTVTFGAEGQWITSRENVHQDLYWSYPYGSKIPVVTMPGNPRNFEIGGVDQSVIDSTRRMWLTLGGLALLLLAGVVVTVEALLRNEYRLFLHGEEVTGIVAGSTLVKGKTTTTTVRYQFQTPLGSQNGHTSFTGNRVADYGEGTPLQILYNPDKPKNSLPIASFQMVQLASEMPVS